MSSVIFQSFFSDDHSAPESIFIPICTFYSQRKEKIKWTKMRANRGKLKT